MSSCGVLVDALRTPTNCVTKLQRDAFPPSTRDQALTKGLKNTREGFGRAVLTHTPNSPTRQRRSDDDDQQTGTSRGETKVNVLKLTFEGCVITFRLVTLPSLDFLIAQQWYSVGLAAG
jgi:hypothetical protein